MVHIEVERDLGATMDRRMEHYFFHLRLKYEEGIIPIVLFLRGGQAGSTQRHVFHRVAGQQINHFTYWSLGLSQWQARPLLKQGPLAIALAACARGDRLPKDEQKFLCMQALLESDVDEAQEQLLVTAIETYLNLNEPQKMKYAERVSQSPRKTELQKWN